MAFLSKITLVLASAVCVPRGALATRSVTTASADNAGVDFEEVVADMHEVNVEKDSDRYVVYGSTGSKLTLVSKPPASQVSLENFKTDLLKCGPIGQICIGFYNVLHPRTAGSSTLKQKTILVKAVDEAGIKAKLGSMIKTKNVVMGTVTAVWGPLQKAVRASSVSPTLKLELADASEIEKLSGQSVWNFVKSKVSRIGDGEEEAFVKHIGARNAQAGGLSEEEETPVEQDASSSENPSPPSSGGVVVKPSPSSGGASSAEVKQLKARIEKLEKKLAEGLEKEVSAAVATEVAKYARKAAAQEVAYALRKLAEKTEEVGNQWLDKSKH